MENSKTTIKNTLAATLAKSIFKVNQRQQSEQSVSATVASFDANSGKYQVVLPDGSQRYVDYIGNNGLQIGQSVAAVFPAHSLYGWIDTKVS